MKINWNPGDDRSYGHFKVTEAPTGLGYLNFSYIFDQAGQIFKVEEFTIGGHDATAFIDLYPDIGAPHDSSTKAVKDRWMANEEKWVKKAIDEFMGGFIETLKEWTGEGVSNPWNIT